jgi:hypothetical protein
MPTYIQGVPTISDPTLWTPVLAYDLLRCGVLTGFLKNITLSVYQWNGSAWVKQ